jgi:type VI secretion system protein ImpB
MRRSARESLMARETSRSDRNARSARVQIAYEVDVDGVLRRKELPFVIGVLADFSGKPAEPPPKLRDRKFIDVSRENFDAVLKSMKPRLAFFVENKLTNDDSRLAVELRFERLEDFEPDQIVTQVEPLRKLVEARRQLSALRAAIARDARRGGTLRRMLADRTRPA